MSRDREGKMGEMGYGKEEVGVEIGDGGGSFFSGI